MTAATTKTRLALTCLEDRATPAVMIGKPDIGHSGSVTVDRFDRRIIPDTPAPTVTFGPSSTAAVKVGFAWLQERLSGVLAGANLQLTSGPNAASLNVPRLGLQQRFTLPALGSGGTALRLAGIPVALSAQITGSTISLSGRVPAVWGMAKTADGKGDIGITGASVAVTMPYRYVPGVGFQFGASQVQWSLGVKGTYDAPLDLVEIYVYSSNGRTVGGASWGPLDLSVSVKGLDALIGREVGGRIDALRDPLVAKLNEFITKALPANGIVTRVGIDAQSLTLSVDIPAPRLVPKVSGFIWDALKKNDWATIP